MHILGISAWYHDSAAALLRDGQVIAAAQEERFTRIKNDASLPTHAMGYCLEAGGVDAGGIDAVVYYEKPLNSLVRVLMSFVAAGPRGARAFPGAVDAMGRRKIWVSYEIEKALRQLGYARPSTTLFCEHHMSHAAAAFHTSPFDSACVMTFDGVGEWATSSIGVGRGRRLELLEEMRFPNSIGLLYSAFTAAAGFEVNSGEYMLMGLAPFGEPTYHRKILDELIDLRDDGSFTTNMAYFDYVAGRRMTNERFDRLVDGPGRAPDGPITQRHCDLARSIQDVTEDIVLRVAHHARELTGETRAVLGGGVALNCVASGRLSREGPFEQIWVPPAPGDAGSALGCALWAWHSILDSDRAEPATRCDMRGSLLGPSLDTDAVADDLAASGHCFERLDDPRRRAERVAGLLAEGAVVAVVQGRMEFGPRALGSRSILADPRDPGMQKRINDLVKGRESFRPFAPAVLAERADDWFEITSSSPFMSFTSQVRGAQVAEAEACRDADLAERLALVDSPLPAVTHIDGSARVQTVTQDAAPDLHRLLVAFDRLTGCPVLLNTSFNVRGEPIVCTAQDALACFTSTDLDYLLIEGLLVEKGMAGADDH